MNKEKEYVTIKRMRKEDIDSIIDIEAKAYGEHHWSKDSFMQELNNDLAWYYSLFNSENKLVAYHEAGHAVVSKYLPTQDQVHEISIVPRGMAGGYTMYRPTEDKNFMSKTEMEENLVSLLGGRVAEQLILNDISTGASNDIERATAIARSMVTKYGMSEKVGTITLGSGQEEVFLGRDFAHSKEYSEETAALVDAEVKRIVDEAYNKAVEILNTHIDKLHAVAGILLEKEKIDGEEFDRIFGE